MAQATTIEWTEAAWNPVRGCSRVPEGCRNCYAERMAMIFAEGQSYEGLRSYEVVLRREQLRAVAEVFEYRVPELAGELGNDVRQRLLELVGIRVTRIPPTDINGVASK